MFSLLGFGDRHDIGAPVGIILVHCMIFRGEGSLELATSRRVNFFDSFCKC